MAYSQSGLRITYIPEMEYGAAWNLQKRIVKAIDEQQQVEHLLLLQHPPTYTIGSQRHPEHLLLSPEQLREQGISVFEIDRGGDITYHGPGQLVGYPLLWIDGSRSLNLHGYLRSLEEVIIRYLATLGIQGTRRERYTGVWIGEQKICAIGVKFNKCSHRRGFVTSHGFALNIRSGIQEEGFRGIIPCGIQDFGVTSLEDATGRRFTPEEAARGIVPWFNEVFGYTGHMITGTDFPEDVSLA